MVEKQEKSESSGRLFPMVDGERSLDTTQLSELELSFRSWVALPLREDHKLSRARIFVIFLLIRYTGARLSEVLNLDPAQDVDYENHIVRFHKKAGNVDSAEREVMIPAVVSDEIRMMVAAVERKWTGKSPFQIDPAHIRKKFYEQAVAVGLTSSLGAPEIIRKSRAVELMQGNMPLQVVQHILGHSTPNLAASYAKVSEDEIAHVAKKFAERENRRKTSARNSFFGKIERITKGEVLVLVRLTSMGGYQINSAITRDSADRLGLKTGMYISAEVKAPLVELCKGDVRPQCSAENMLQGKVLRAVAHDIAAEVVVQLDDETNLCAMITADSFDALAPQPGDMFWVFFDAFAVVLHLD